MRKAKAIPENAVACVMTPVPSSAQSSWEYALCHNGFPPGKTPTALCMYFAGFGMRRVYRRKAKGDGPKDYNGLHVVQLERRWHVVDISTMALESRQ